MTRHAPRGFTLAEVLVALAITAFIGGSVWGSFNQGFRAKEMIEGEALLYRELRTGTSRIAREISMAFISNNYDPARFRDNASRPTFFIGETDKLSFSMLGHQRLSRDAKESDQSIVFYKVDRDPDEKGLSSFLRCEKPVIDDEPERCNRWETLISDVKKVEFFYWDNKKKDWAEEWDTRRIEHPEQLPDRVKIVLHSKNELGKDQTYVTQARINMVTSLERR
jgi:general secretion pathway protein J